MRPASKARRRGNRRAEWLFWQRLREMAGTIRAEQARYEDLPDLLDPSAIKKYHIGLDPEAAARLIKEHLVPVVQADGKTWIPKAALWRYYNLPVPN